MFPKRFFLSIPLDVLSMKLIVGTDKWTFNFICYYFELCKVHKIATNKTKQCSEVIIIIIESKGFKYALNQKIIWRKIIYHVFFWKTFIVVTSINDYELKPG